jgi:hypothetical protein
VPSGTCGAAEYSVCLDRGVGFQELNREAAVGTEEQSLYVCLLASLEQNVPKICLWKCVDFPCISDHGVAGGGARRTVEIRASLCAWMQTYHRARKSGTMSCQELGL